MSQQKFLPSFSMQRIRGATSEHKKFLKDEFITHFNASASEINAFKNVVFEIGAGNGETAVHFAENNPDVLYIACEVFLDGVLQMAGKAHSKNLTNIRFFMKDARILLDEISNEGLSQVFLFFPDPWPKKRHHKRRILNLDFLKFVFQKLKIGGNLFIATDHPSYMEHVKQIMEEQKLFQVSEEGFPAWWIQTKYQVKALNEGRNSRFFVFKKVC